MSDVREELQRGALVNALGTVGKIAGPAFLVLVIRLYGADVWGIFATASALIEMAIAFLTAGFKDAALIFVARHADDEGERPHLYQALVNALGWSLLFAVVLIALAQTVGPYALPRLYEYGDRLLNMLEWMVLMLPLLAFERTVLAATQGLKIMKYEALVNGGVRPVTLLASAAAIWPFAPNVMGLTVAYVVTQILVFLLALGIYQRELAWRPLLHAARTFELNREMLGFALPQNLNQTFERFLTNIDIIMLGFFGVSAATTGFYAAGALIVRELRQIRLVFSSAFAPHIVRLHRKDALGQLAGHFAAAARWIVTLTIPVLLGLAVLRTDLLHLVSPEFAGEEALFMLFLLPIPFLQNAFGLAGNVVVMTGHSRLNLLNSVSTGAVNTVLNLLLIPPLGPVGAAAASSLAALVKATMEVTEMRLVVGVPLLFGRMYQPYVAGAVAAAALVAVAYAVPWFDQSVLHRIALAAGAMLLFGLMLVALRGGLPHQPDTLQQHEEADG